MYITYIYWFYLKKTEYNADDKYSSGCRGQSVFFYYFTCFPNYSCSLIYIEIPMTNLIQF